MLTCKGEEDWSPFWLNVFISVPLLRLTALPSSKLNWVIIWIFYYTDLMCFNQLILERGLHLVAIKICQATIWKDALKHTELLMRGGWGIKSNLAEPNRNYRRLWTDRRVNTLEDLSPLNSWILRFTQTVHLPQRWHFRLSSGLLHNRSSSFSMSSDVWLLRYFSSSHSFQKMMLLTY